MKSLWFDAQVEPSLSNCFTATCDGDEEVTTKSYLGGVELENVSTVYLMTVQLRVTEVADVQTTEEIVVLYLREDVALSSMGTGITIIQRSIRNAGLSLMMKVIFT